MGKIPFEIILKIYDYCDIDTKLKLHKIFGDIFFTKKRRQQFLKSQSEQFLKVLNCVLRFKLNHIEIVTIISRLGRQFDDIDNIDF